MLVRQKIEINGDPKALSSLLDPLLKQSKASGFSAERPTRQSHLNDAIEVTDKNSGLFFLLELFEKDQELAVYPPPYGTIEEDETWNKTVSDFYTKVIEPVCKNAEVKFRLTPASKGIDECFSDRLVSLLQTTVRAPRSTTERFRAWTEFLVRAAIESGESQDDHLGRWLEQEGKQPDDEVNSMLADYHAAYWIMSEYFRLYPDAPGAPKKSVVTG